MLRFVKSNEFLCIVVERWPKKRKLQVLKLIQYIFQTEAHSYRNSSNGYPLPYNFLNGSNFPRQIWFMRLKYIVTIYNMYKIITNSIWKKSSKQNENKYYNRTAINCWWKSFNWIIFSIYFKLSLKNGLETVVWFLLKWILKFYWKWWISVLVVIPMWIRMDFIKNVLHVYWKFFTQ